MAFVKGIEPFASEAWDTLYRELLTYVTRKVGDRAAAQDILQEVFIKVHTRSQQLRGTDKMTPWIYRITRNAVADYFRARNRQVVAVDIDAESSEHQFNDCVAYCLMVLCKTLPDKYRIALELADVDRLSQYELATRLNISYSGARSRVQRARKMLREKLYELYVIQTDPYGNVIGCENRKACCCSADC